MPTETRLLVETVGAPAPGAVFAELVAAPAPGAVLAELVAAPAAKVPVVGQAEVNAEAD